MDMTLTAETGRVVGSRSSTRLRGDGMVPGVVYGLGRDTVSIAVAWPDLRRALSTEAGVNALITLEVDGRTDLAIIKDLQRHPVRRTVEHVDFLRVDADAPVAVDVPVVLTGEAPKVEARRGVVDQPLKSLTVLAKPADIPATIEVAIDDIDIGDTLTVGELVLPPGVSTDVDPEYPVVSGMGTRFTVQLDHGVDPEDLTLEGEEAAGGEEAAAEGASGDEATAEADEE